MSELRELLCRIINTVVLLREISILNYIRLKLFNVYAYKTRLTKIMGVICAACIYTRIGITYCSWVKVNIETFIVNFLIILQQHNVQINFCASISIDYCMHRIAFKEKFILSHLKNGNHNWLGGQRWITLW